MDRTTSGPKVNYIFWMECKELVLAHALQRKLNEIYVIRSECMDSIKMRNDSWFSIFFFSFHFRFVCGVACLPIRFTLLGLTCVVPFITIQFATSMRLKKMQQISKAREHVLLSLHDIRGFSRLKLHTGRCKTSFVIIAAVAHCSQPLWFN